MEPGLLLLLPGLGPVPSHPEWPKEEWNRITSCCVTKMLQPLKVHFLVLVGPESVY